MRLTGAVALCLCFLCGCTDNSGKTNLSGRNDPPKVLPPGVSASGGKVKAEVSKGITQD